MFHTDSQISGVFYYDEFKWVKQANTFGQLKMDTLYIYLIYLCTVLLFNENFKRVFQIYFKNLCCLFKLFWHLIIFGQLGKAKPEKFDFLFARFARTEKFNFLLPGLAKTVLFLLILHFLPALLQKNLLERYYKHQGEYSCIFFMSDHISNGSIDFWLIDWFELEFHWFMLNWFFVWSI